MSRAYRQSLAQQDPSFTSICASHLARQGAAKRRGTTREHIRATARAMNEDMGRAIPEALLP